jgi:hypothetical protein
MSQPFECPLPFRVSDWNILCVRYLLHVPFISLAWTIPGKVQGVPVLQDNTQACTQNYKHTNFLATWILVVILTLRTLYPRRKVGYRLHKDQAVSEKNLYPCRQSNFWLQTWMDEASYVILSTAPLCPIIFLLTLLSDTIQSVLLPSFDRTSIVIKYYRAV